MQHFVTTTDTLKISHVLMQCFIFFFLMFFLQNVRKRLRAVYKISIEIDRSMKNSEAYSRVEFVYNL